MPRVNTPASGVWPSAMAAEGADLLMHDVPEDKRQEVIDRLKADAEKAAEELKERIKAGDVLEDPAEQAAREAGYPGFPVKKKEAAAVVGEKAAPEDEDEDDDEDDEPTARSSRAGPARRGPAPQGRHHR